MTANKAASPADERCLHAIPFISFIIFLKESFESMVMKQQSD
jgi:hypothetical protein